MDLKQDFLMSLTNQGTKILTMILTLFYKVLQVMILMVELVKVTRSNMVASEVQAVLNLKLKMNGNKKILKRDTKKVKTDC